jgi:retron-type reverse transcriptase
MMDGHEKSDSAMVAGKASNKAGQPAAETMERRAEAKESANQQITRRAQNRESVSRALNRVRNIASQRKKERLTTLFHHITVDLLRLSFLALKRDAAPGVDGVAWQDYERDLEQKLSELHEKIHKGAYRAKPSGRRYILIADGRQRPLAVAALDDKIVQRAAA